MIPPELQGIPQWVCALNESKCPWRGWEFEPASSSDPSTWCDYETATEAVQNGYYDNIGFVFNDNDIIGIDIDNGFDESGLITLESAKIIGRFRSYTEKSRSGRGFHILVRGKLPFSGRNNRNGMEIYQSKRFFIMTGNVVRYDQLVENQPAIDWLVDNYFKLEEKTTSSGLVVNPRIYNPVWQKPTGNRIKLRPVYPEIPKGCRNTCLTSLAGLMHNIGYSPESIAMELAYVNEVACQPMVDDSEIQGIVRSVTRYKR